MRAPRDGSPPQPPPPRSAPVAQAKHARRRRGAPVLRRGERCPKRLKQLEVARGFSGARRAAAALARAVEVDRARGARPVQRRPAATPAGRHVSRAGAGRGHSRAPRGAGGAPERRRGPRRGRAVRRCALLRAVGGRGVALGAISCGRRAEAYGPRAPLVRRDGACGWCCVRARARRRACAGPGVETRAPPRLAITTSIPRLSAASSCGRRRPRT